MDPWTISTTAASQAYKHREEIGTVWEGIISRIRGEKVSIAVTGMPGVGKSVLLDSFTSKAHDPTYSPPPKSIGVEQVKLRAKKLRMRFKIIPGQGDSPLRKQGLDDIAHAKRPIAGLIHVVANGYTEIRSELARAALQEEMSLQEFRENQLKLEISDLDQTLEYVRPVVRRQKRPFWIVVAVNKVDLFPQSAQLADAQRHYASDGAFVDVVKQFIAHVGADNAQWEARPVCAWPEAFSWGSETVTSQIDRGQQLDLLYRMTATVRDYSVAVKA